MPALPTASVAIRPQRERGRCVLIGLILAAVLAQALALAGVHRLRGDVTAYAFQSPDAAEYVALARGIAWHGRYIQLDSEGRPLTGPDTWRTPGYPLFLALIVRVAGDSPLILLAAQQIVAIASVPLFWLVLRPLTRPRWALLAALAWCCDPFRLYYSLWLLSETVFTFVLLVACWVWVRKGGQDALSARRLDPISQAGSGRPERADGGRPPCRLFTPDTDDNDPMTPSLQSERAPLPSLPGEGQGGTQGPSSAPAATSSTPYPNIRPRAAFALGLLVGLLVLVRPIAVPLPLLALIGVAIVAWRSSWRHWLTLNLLYLAGIALTLGPWLVRNQIVAGHFALSQQSGASLAYHKVVDVVLWSEGRAESRFNPEAAAEIRERIDERLRREWPDRYGPLTDEQLQTLTWRNLNYGKPVAVDPFHASAMLWSIGLDMLADRPAALIKSFIVQGTFMLIFPLGLLLWPPAGTGSAPMSMLLGGRGALAATVIPALIGLAYAGLTLWILARLVASAIHRRWPAGFFAFWPALAMFTLSLPFEDPRFRLPIIPLFWILAVAQRPAPARPS